MTLPLREDPEHREHVVEALEAFTLALGKLREAYYGEERQDRRPRRLTDWGACLDLVVEAVGPQRGQVGDLRAATEEALNRLLDKGLAYEPTLGVLEML